MKGLKRQLTVSDSTWRLFSSARTSALLVQIVTPTRHLQWVSLTTQETNGEQQRQRKTFFIRPTLNWKEKCRGSLCACAEKPHENSLNVSESLGKFL